MVEFEYLNLYQRSDTLFKGLLKDWHIFAFLIFNSAISPWLIFFLTTWTKTSISFLQISNEDSIIPGWEGKIVAWVETDTGQWQFYSEIYDSDISSNINVLFIYALDIACGSIHY